MMLTVEFAILLGCTGTIALASLATAAKNALPRIAAIRQALDAAPTVREVRFTIREVVVRREGNVVALPLRQPVRSLPPLRAAA